MSITTTRNLNMEKLLYAVIFFLALAIRLLNLGESALSEHEAGFALRAYNLAHSQTTSQMPISTSQPVYVIITGLVFALFKDTNAIARLLPALAGSCLVWAPLLFRKWLGENNWFRRAGLLLALGLALDPALVALSRQAGSPIIALAMLIFAISFILQGWAGLGGLVAGFALMSGPGIIQGLLVLVLSGLAYLYLRRYLEHAESLPIHWPEFFHQRGFWRTLLYVMAGTILLVSMLWLRVPQGLALFANTLPSYLRGWIDTSGIPALRLPAAILLYQPIPVVFGLLSAIRGWRYPHQPIFTLQRFLSLWAATALVLVMIYPSRQIADGIWVVVPLWILAALELSRFAAAPIEVPLRLPTLGLAGVSALFLILIWYNLLRLGNLQAQPVLYLTIIGGLGIMTGIVISLVGLGWSWRTASTGFTMGFCLVAGGYMLAAMWSASQVRSNHPAEFWATPPGAGQINELVSTLEEIAQWNSGLRNELDIQITFSSTSLQWALRNFNQVEFVSTLSAEQPDIILTLSSQENPSLVSLYRGQELIFSQPNGWNGAWPPNLLRWLTFREFAATSQKMILWARSDLFPGGLSDQGSQGLAPIP
jgi:hypothetical protein